MVKDDKSAINVPVMILETTKTGKYENKQIEVPSGFAFNITAQII